MRGLVVLFAVTSVWFCVLAMGVLSALIAVIGPVLLVLFIFGGVGAIAVALVNAANRSHEEAAQYSGWHMLPPCYTSGVRTSYPPVVVSPLVSTTGQLVDSLPQSTFRQRRRPSELTAAVMRHGAPR